MATRSVTLGIDRIAEHPVEMRGDDLWLETGFTGEYSDVGTQAEAEILVELQSARWQDVVARRFAEANPWLYKIITDSGRALFLDLLSIPRNGVFLDVGSGWGQVAIPLSKGGHVFCLDVTLSRLNILMEIARQEDARLHYICGDFRTFPFEPQQFDLVIFNGSLEYLAMDAVDLPFQDAQLAALKKACEILKPGGAVYVGIENSLGLKYLLGAPDDHTGIPYLTFLSESRAQDLCRETDAALRAKTWSLAEYRELFQRASLTLEHVYGCFPDYKLIRQMIPIADVNQVLGEKGMLFPEHNGSDGSPLPFGNTLDQLYRLLARNGIAEYFCPSYALVARRPQ